MRKKIFVTFFLLMAFVMMASKAHSIAKASVDRKPEEMCPPICKASDDRMSEDWPPIVKASDDQMSDDSLLPFFDA